MKNEIQILKIENKYRKLKENNEINNEIPME
jgi:hypothetical protein